MQMDQDMKRIDKLNEYNAPSVRINSRFEVLANLKDTTYTTDLRNEMIHKSNKSYNNGGNNSFLRKIKPIVNYIPVIVNGETIINNCENLVSYIGSVHISPNKINNLNYNILENEMNDVNNHKIMVVGDSHLRASAIRIGEYLGKKIKVCGMIKPDASIVDMVIKSGMNYMCLTKKDVIVFLGGSNDVYRNNSVTALTQIVKFCGVVNNTNIIVLDIPHRYDLDNNSIVNKEIQTFNRKVRKITKHFNDVSILEVSFNREAFTQHGLHLNRLGKCLIAKQIKKKTPWF
jgi:hypothetical protein